MAEERVSNELIYEVLKAIQTELRHVQERMDRLEDRMGRVETLLGDLVKADLHRNAEMDALRRRIDRIERRLDIADA